MTLGGLVNEADLERFTQKILDNDPRLRPSRSPAVVTALPLEPKNGQVVYFLADATNGIVWTLKYRANSASAYKWEVVGGSSLVAEVATSETTASGSYVALTTPGPSLALPLAGDYDVKIGSIIASTGEFFSAMSYDIGGSAAVDADRVSGVGGNGNEVGASREQRKAALAAVTLTAKYRVGGGTGTFLGRQMRAMPVRVG